MRNWIAIGITLIIVIGGVSLLYPSFRGSLKDPLKEIQEQRLALQDVPFQEQNAFLDFAKLDKEKDLFFPENVGISALTQVEKFESSYPTVTNEILAKNKKLLSTALMASQKPIYQNTLTAEVANISFDPDPNAEASKEWETQSLVREGTSLLILKGLTENKLNNSEEAVDNLVAAMKLGNLITNSQASSIEYLMGIGLTTKALKAYQDVEKSQQLNQGQINYAHKQIALLSANPSGLAASIKGDYKVLTDGMEKYHNGSVPIENISEDQNGGFKFLKNPYHFSYTMTQKASRESYDELLKGATNACEAKIPSDNISSAGLIFKRNSVGRLLIDNSISIHTNIFERTCERQQLINEILKK